MYINRKALMLKSDFQIECKSVSVSKRFFLSAMAIFLAILMNSVCSMAIIFI